MTHKRADGQLEAEPDPSDLLPVMFAANKAEAEFYQTLLADADIQAVIDTETDNRAGQVGKGVAILVRAELLDEASDIITAREEIEEHILAGPDSQEQESDEEGLASPDSGDDTADDEDLLFRRDPFAGKEDHY